LIFLTGSGSFWPGRDCNFRIQNPEYRLLITAKYPIDFAARDEKDLKDEKDKLPTAYCPLPTAYCL